MKNNYSQIRDFQTKKNININSNLGRYILFKYLNKIGGGTAPAINGPCPKSSDFYCPISGEYMTDPVICSDGHSYQRANIRTWLLSSNKSPMTMKELTNRVLIPNISLRNAIKEYRRWLAEEEKKMSSIEDKVDLGKSIVKPTIEADSSNLKSESSASVESTQDSSNQESEPQVSVERPAASTPVSVERPAASTPVRVERSAPSTTISRPEATEDEDEDEDEEEDADLLNPPDKFWEELGNLAWQSTRTWGKSPYRLSIQGNEDRYEVNTILKKIWTIMMWRTTGAQIDINKINSTPHFLVMMSELGILENMYIYYFGKDRFYRDMSPSQMLIKICTKFERLGPDVEKMIDYLIYGSDSDSD